MHHIIFIIMIFFYKISYIDCGSFLKKESRPYVTVSYVRKCPVDKNTLQFIDASVGMISKSGPALNITWTALEQFDDTYKIELTMLKWADGGWKKHFYVEETKGCTMFLKVFGDIWKEIAQSNNISSTCPVKKGHYDIINQKVSASVALGPLLVWPGRFIIRLKFIHLKKTQVCYETELTIMEILAHGGEGLFDDWKSFK